MGLVDKMVKCLRPGERNRSDQRVAVLLNAYDSGGVLLIADGGSKTRILDEGATECWNLKFLNDSFRTGADNAYFGEKNKDLVSAHATIALCKQKEYWFNGNWVDPNDKYGKEVVELMEHWIPVRVYTFLWFSRKADLERRRKSAVKVVMPVLRRNGWTKEMEEECLRMTVEELHTGYPRYSSSLVLTWAVKKEAMS